MKKKITITVLSALLTATMALGVAACTESHTHTFSDEWSKDATNHWHAATCEHTEEKSGSAAHVYDDDEDASCNVCGYERTIGGTEHEHAFSEEWSKDENGHWHAATCEHTEEKSGAAAHEYDDDEDTSCNVCGYERTAEQFSAPVIDLELGAEITITAGEPIDPFLDVTATDTYDGDLTDSVDIENPDGLDFDEPAVGVYRVTYKVTNSKGKTGTAERTYTVEAPKPNLIVEVETERDTNWVAGGHESGKMVFKNEQYIVIDENTEKTTEDGVDENGKAYVAGVVYYKYAITGVFYNSTEEEVVVHMQGSGGEVAILDSAGFVVEARDGANGRFVNKDYTVRTSGPSTFPAYDGSNVAATNHGFYMQIPAGGWAVVVSNDGTFGEQGNFNADGRGWLNKNLVSQYGWVANLYFEDAPETLLNEYFDHAPVILSKNDVQVRVNDAAANINELVVAGISYVDDDGTWTATDDIKTGLTIDVLGSTPTFDVTVEGEYIFTLKITDPAGNFTEFTRKVIVIPAQATEPTIEIDGIWYNHATLPIGVNVDPTENPDNYYAIVYTSYYVGEFIKDDFGCYFVVDANGKVVETYQPQNGKYYRQGESGIVETAKANTDILKGVEIPAGGYVVLAVYSADSNNFNIPMRERIKEADRMLGSEVKLHLIDYLPAITVTPENGNARSLKGTTMYVNQPAPSAAAASKATALIYDYTYGGEIVCNGNGAAVVVKDGKIVRIYDAANGRLHDAEHYWDTDNNSLSWTGLFDGNNYAQVAVDSLTEGEYVIIFPNDGTNGADSPRTFGLGLRQRFLQYTVSLNIKIPEWKDPTEEEEPVVVPTVTVSAEGAANKEWKAETLYINEPAPSASAASKANLLIYDYTYRGAVVCNGNGVAVVVKDGKIVRIYDAANGRLHDAEHYWDTDNNSLSWTGLFDGNNYAQVAVGSLAEGEYVMIFPNDGVNGASSPRTFALGLRQRFLQYTVTLNFEIPAWTPAITVSKEGAADKILSGTMIINEAAASASAASKATALIYTWTYEGAVVCNGSGVAVVVKDGKIVRIYDAANGRLHDAEHNWDTENNSQAYNGATYAQDAVDSLEEGEYVIIFPNDGVNAADSPRSFGLGLRQRFWQYTVTLNFEF